MESVTIRVAVPDDAKLLTSLAAETFRETFAQHNDPADMDAYMTHAFEPSVQEAEIREPGSTVLLAFVGDEPAGYARVALGDAPDCVTAPRPIELVRMYASSTWHGRGIARRLMDACLEEAGRRGAESIWLGVWERNARAIAFYRKCGFVECGRKVFVLGSDEQTDLVMWRPVADSAK